MKQPIQITVDPDHPVAYVEYRNFDEEGAGSLRLLREPDGRVEEYGVEDGRGDESSGVSVDLNQNDEVVGIEIIDVDAPELVALARDYAAARDLAFPVDIRAAAARNPAA